MKQDTAEQLSPITITLHWIVAIMMLMLLSSGIYMTQNHIYALYPWHKSFGVVIMLFVVLRVIWRIINGWPKPVGDYSIIEKILAKLVHYLLIIGTILMPISGFMMSVMGGHGVAVFGFELIAPNHDPNNPQAVVALNAGIAKIAHTMHSIGGYTIVVAVILHIIGAFKHHIIDKDGTLRRMLGKKV